MITIHNIKMSSILSEYVKIVNFREFLDGQKHFNQWLYNKMSAGRAITSEQYSNYLTMKSIMDYCMRGMLTEAIQCYYQVQNLEKIPYFKSSYTMRLSKIDLLNAYIDIIQSFENKTGSPVNKYKHFFEPIHFYSYDSKG